MKNIKHLLDVVDKVRDDVALGLMSDPGLSKTSQVKQWAEDNGRNYCELIISQRMPSEISGMPMPISETRTMEVFDFDTLLQLKDGDVLAFDEFTNGNIQTLNACLTLIQERTMLSGRKLPSLVIVAMGNPQGRCDLLPQTKQRFWWVDVAWDEKSWVEYMEKTWNITPNRTILREISDTYVQGFGNQNKFNYYTPRTMENLFRISMHIDRDDPFWAAGEVREDLVAAIYSSKNLVSTFALIKQDIDEWFSHAAQTSTNTVLQMKVAGCANMAELRKVVTELTDDDWVEEFMVQLDRNATVKSDVNSFIEFLKTNDLSELA